MTLAIDNPRSSIARKLIELVPDETIVGADAVADRYLFCGGFLAGHKLTDLAPHDANRSFADNFVTIASRCDWIIETNREARIAIIGSLSGDQGSYDMAYAGAKAAMHLYIGQKRLLGHQQQLVGIAPAVIWDTGMTQRRGDLALCEKRGAATRRGRWLLASEVAALIHFLLYVDTGSISNTVIRMTGGNW